MALELKGQLTAEALNQVLDTLAEGAGAYSFLASDGVSEKIFYFAIGGMRMLNLGRSRSLLIGDMLVACGKLKAADRDRVLKDAREQQKSFGQAAIDMDLVTRADIESMVRDQLEGEFCDLFYWSEAEFEFREGQPPEQFYEASHQASSLSCDVAAFVESIRERVRKWRSAPNAVSSDSEVLHLTADGRASIVKGGDRTLGEFLRYCDGKRRIREILAVSNLSALDVYESLYTGLSKGYLLRIGDRGEGIEADHEAVLEEIKKLEKARGEMVGDLIIRSRLAKAYERVSYNAKAATVWKEIAGIHRRRNNLTQVLISLQNAARCLPQDFNAREQILEVYRTMGEMGKFVEEGFDLAESLFKNNLLNRARNLLGSLVNTAPNDPRIRKLYALTLLGLGRREQALFELKKLADTLETNGATNQELKEVYRRILSLDKNDRSCRRKLLLLTRGRKAIWILRAAVAAAVLVLLAGGGGFIYERLARATYSEESEKILNLIHRNKFDEARVLVRDLQKRYPISSIGRRATDLLGRVDVFEREYLRRGLPRDFRDAELAESAGDFGKALAIYSRIGRFDPGKFDEGEGEYVAEAKEHAERIKSAEASAKGLIRKANRDARVGELDSAIRIYREVRSLYPLTRAVRSVNYPARIRTVPAGAGVFLNGVEIDSDEEGAFISYSLSSKHRLRLEAPGYEPLVLDIETILDAETELFLRKSTRWVFEGSGPFESTPVVSDGTLYIAGRDRNLYAISTDDGKVQFTVRLGIFGDSSSTVAVVGDRVIVATARGEILGVSRGRGRVVWRCDLADSISGSVVPSADGKAVVVNDVDGRTTALDARTGIVLWSTAAAATPGSAPAVRGDDVYVGSCDLRQVTILAMSDGHETGKVPVGSAVATTPAVEGSYVCVGSDDFTFQALNADTQASVASFCTNGMVKARPIMIRGNVYVGSTDGGMYACRVAGGQKLYWSRRLDKPIVGAATVTEDHIFVGSTGGFLYCLSKKDGHTVWRFTTGDKIVSQPILVDGTIYVASMDGKIYAIEL